MLRFNVVLEAFREETLLCLRLDLCWKVKVQKNPMFSMLLQKPGRNLLLPRLVLKLPSERPSHRRPGVCHLWQAHSGAYLEWEQECLEWDLACLEWE
jgi:hypothetical protein